MKELSGASRRFTFLVLGIALLAGLGSFTAVYGLAQRSGAALPACQGNCVHLNRNGAAPDVVTVAAGNFVEFTAADGKRHNISLVEHGHDSIQEDGQKAGHQDDQEDSHGASENGGHIDQGYTSGDFAADEAWRVQFKQDGSFTFVDKYNPKIHVNVVVYTPGKDYKIQ